MSIQKIKSFSVLWDYNIARFEERCRRGLSSERRGGTVFFPPLISPIPCVPYPFQKFFPMNTG
jgi:hypothetical protein